MTATKPRAPIIVCASCGARNRVTAVADGVPHCGKCRTALPWVVDATDAEFQSVVSESSMPVLIDVWAPWCGPCRRLTPALEKLAGELAGQLKLVKINADDNPEVSRRFDVQAIPTLIILDHGEVVAQQVGALPGPQLRSWLESKLPTRA